MTDGHAPVLVAALALSLCGVLVIWLARRGGTGRLPRNHLAGVRTSLTLSSDIAWNAAHRASARAMTIAGWGPIVSGPVAVLLIVVGPPTDATAIAAAVLLLAGAVWLVAWSLGAAAQAQRAAGEVANND